MQRRTFVHALGASLATGPWASRVIGSPRRLNRIGLELYSVRDAMGRDPDGTLAAVRAMGYTDVELLWSFGNFGRTTEQVRAALDHEGLHAPSARSEEHTSELQSPCNLVCRLLLEKKKTITTEGSSVSPSFSE